MSLPPTAAEGATTTRTGGEERLVLQQVATVTKRTAAGGSQQQQQPITLILPTSGKLFYEKKQDFQLCKPHLLPLKSFSLEKLEKMQKEAHRQLQETRARTAAAAENF